MKQITLHGFRPGLFEIAAIFAIIALVAGGLLVGRSLIHVAELQSIITDKEHYLSATRQFRSKYQQLPGDMTTATKLWGTDPCGCPCLAMGNGYNIKPRKETCDGNGNGLIENDGDGSDGQEIATHEHFRAWQQLAASGFLGGAFTGAQGAGGTADVEPGANVPQSKLNYAGFEWLALQSPYGLAAWYAQKFPTMQYRHQYLLFGMISGHPFDLRGPVLTPGDAAGIDAKTDDGLPMSGSVMASVWWNNQGRCMTGSTPAQYDTATQLPYCIMLFDAPL